MNDCVQCGTPVDGRKFYCDKCIKERRNRQWWESRARCGYASTCPICGKYTESPTGICRTCSKKVK